MTDYILYKRPISTVAGAKHIFVPFPDPGDISQHSLMATNATGPMSLHLSEGILNATDGLDRSPEEPTGKDTIGEASLQGQVRLMRDQLEILRSRIQKLEHSTRVGQRKTRIPQHEEDSSQVSRAEEENLDDQETADQKPGNQKLNNHGLDDQVSDDDVSDNQETYKQELEDSGLENQESVESIYVPTTPRLRRVEWSEFKNLYLNETPLHAIDVLVGPPRYYWQRGSEDKNIKHDPHSFKYQVARKDSFRKEFDPNVGQIPNAVPERIRINSELILSNLNDISSERIPTDQPQVFIQPYKLIVASDAKIRQRLKDLESKWINGPGTRRKDRGRGTINSIENASHITSDSESAASGTSREASVDGKRERSPNDPSNSFDALQDLRCLVEFMDNYITPVLRKYRSGPEPTKKIAFRNLWYLFQPGDDVLCTLKADNTGITAPEPDLQSLWRVLHVSEGRPHLSENSRKIELINPFKMLCFKIGYNGNNFGPITYFFEIQPFGGEKDIVSLNVVPIRMAEYPKGLIDQWRDLGSKFRTFTVPQHHIYVGPTLLHHTNGERCVKVQRSESLNGSVIIDVKAAVREDEQWVPQMGIPWTSYGDTSEIKEDFKTCLWSGRKEKRLVREICSGETYNDDWVDGQGMDDIISKNHFLSQHKSTVDNMQMDSSSLSDDDLILLPERICGFDVHRRRFALFDVKRLQSVDMQTEGWKDLKLLRGHKDMIQAQVRNHFAEKSFRSSYQNQRSDIDLIRGKGEGLIILLHGTPGVGKTSTAECVAASIGKPLYPITCGDLGTSATEVENGLYEVFSQAEAWDCVLLLDEADVFLAQRTRTDLDRNAIVSGK